MPAKLNFIIKEKKYTANGVAGPALSFWVPVKKNSDGNRNDLVADGIGGICRDVLHHERGTKHIQE
jgi:hypothetical protein